MVEQVVEITMVLLEVQILAAVLAVELIRLETVLQVVKVAVEYL